MSKPRIYYPATEQGFNRIEGQPVFFEDGYGFEYFAYKQPKGGHKTAGWHVCEVTSGVAITTCHSSFPAAYDAACVALAELTPRALDAKVKAAITAHGRAPEPEEIKP